MPYDPALPANGSKLSSAEMRAQLTGLKELIDAIPAGPPGPEGAPGIPGEVTAQQLADGIATTSANTNAVTTLNLIVSAPPTQAEVQALADKLDELILAQRR